VTFRDEIPGSSARADMRLARDGAAMTIHLFSLHPCAAPPS